MDQVICEICKYEFDDNEHLKTTLECECVYCLNCISKEIQKRNVFRCKVDGTVFNSQLHQVDSFYAEIIQQESCQSEEYISQETKYNLQQQSQKKYKDKIEGLKFTSKNKFNETPKQPYKIVYQQQSSTSESDTFEQPPMFQKVINVLRKNEEFQLMGQSNEEDDTLIKMQPLKKEELQITQKKARSQQGEQQEFENQQKRIKIEDSPNKKLNRTDLGIYTALIDTQQDLFAEQNLTQVGSCNKHLKIPIEIYCKQCNVFICCKCTIFDHKGHDYTELNLTISEFQKEFSDLVHILQQQKKNANELIQNADFNIKKIFKYEKNYIDKLYKLKKQIVESIENQFK